jgi:hypothetical protein
VSTLRLYEIPIEFERIAQALEESGGELTPEIQAAWEAIEAAGAEKVEATACVVKSMGLEAEALAAEIGRLQGRKESLESAQARLKSLLVPALEALGGKVKTPRFTVYNQTRSTQAFELKPGVNAWELDARFYRVRDPELNKAALKDALKAGEPLPEGVVMSEGSTTYPVIR